MSLNLGLESLGIIENDDVSEATVLSNEIASLEAQMDSERAMFSAVTAMRNYYNFNEIVTSLQKHSSAECVAFAQELVGQGISLEAEEAQAPAEGAKAAATSKWEAAKAKIKKWWHRFVTYVRICKLWVRKQIRILVSKIKNIGKGNTMKVTYSSDTIEKIYDLIEDLNTGDGEDISTFTKVNELLTAKQEKAEINLLDDGADYLRQLSALQGVLGTVMDNSKWATKIQSGNAESMKVIVALQKTLPKVQNVIRGEISKLISYLNKSATSYTGKMQKFEEKKAAAAEKGKEAPKAPEMK